jgi:protein-L-isoaspartate(D-aspartate) O-methyltransferase
MDADSQAKRLQAHRSFYARLITANGGLQPGSELEAALAATPREKFVGPPPWKVFTRAGYIDTNDRDPAILYQDVVVSLGVDGSINNGQPTLHTYCISALAIRKGEHIVHIGAGSGYYTAILAQLAGETGALDAYEIHPELAARAEQNLAEFRRVTVHARSGAEPPLPACGVIYVNAGASEPLAIWLDALKPNGRLLFPLAPGTNVGGMLLVTRQQNGAFAARFLTQAQFIPCVGAQNESESAKLTEAFRNGRWPQVKSLHRDDNPDDTCWYAGAGWWLSSDPPASEDPYRNDDLESTHSSRSPR